MARRARPRVTWVFGATLDGRVAAPDGTSRWISSRAARVDAHRLRAAHDAVLVGSGAARIDDPHLAVRHGVAGRPPLRVVLDARASIVTAVVAGRRHGRADARRDRAGGRRPGPPAACRGRPRARSTPSGRLSLPALLRELARRGVATLLVEGGPTIAGSFLAEGLVDEVVGYVRAAVLGAGRPLLDLPGVDDDRRPAHVPARRGRRRGRGRADPDDGAPRRRAGRRARRASRGGGGRAASAGPDALQPARERSGERDVLVGPVVRLRRDPHEHLRRAAAVERGRDRERDDRDLDPVLVEQLRLEALGGRAGRRDARERDRRPSSRASRPAPAPSTRARRTGCPEPRRARARVRRHRGPSSRRRGCPPTYRIAAGSDEVGRRVGGAQPVELEAEARPVGPVVVGAVGDRRADGSGPGGRRARGARPSPSGRTATCGRCRSSTRRRARRGRPRPCPGACAPSTSVSTPRRSSSRTIASDREDEGGRGRHVAHEREPRAGRHRVQVRLDGLGRVVDRERDPDDAGAWRRRARRPRGAR